MEKKRILKTAGFTLVELLTVMSIIAILIGLLAPALNKVRDIATDTKQKAQFHAIAVALDIFKGEMEEYPDSDVVGPASEACVGAHRLAEALIGRDFLGYDPMSTWDAAADEGSNLIYASVNENSNQDEEDDSLDRRKGPYLNSENIEAYQISQIYTDAAGNSTPGTLYPGNLDNSGILIAGSKTAPVLTDAYRVKRVTLPNGKRAKAGSPILYYKADTSSRNFPEIDDSTDNPDAMVSIYNSIDNEELLMLNSVKEALPHKFNETPGDGRKLFYNAITNPKITSVARPYNQDSYILISAGKDGIYGTSDDIFNFND